MRVLSLTSLFINFHRFPAHFTIAGSTLATPSLLKAHLVVEQLTVIELVSASGKARRAGPHLQVDPGAKKMYEFFGENLIVHSRSHLTVS